MSKIKQSVAVAILVCNYSTWKVEEGGSRPQDQPPIHRSSRLVGLKKGGWMDG